MCVLASVPSPKCATSCFLLVHWIVLLPIIAHPLRVGASVQMEWPLSCERPEEPLVRMRILKKASSFGWIMRSIVQISDQFGFKIKHPFGLLYLSTHQFHRRHPHPFSLFSLHLEFFILAHVFRNLWTHHGGMAGAKNDGWRD